MTSLNCCSGVKDTCIPQGKVVRIGKVDTYVAKGAREDKSKVIIIATDVFGYLVPNPKNIADKLALETGYNVYVPDLFHGRELPDLVFDQMLVVRKVNVVYMVWIYLTAAFRMLYFMVINSQKESIGIIQDLMSALQEQEVTTFGIQGYCWGGKVSLTMASRGQVKCAVACHPGALMLSPTFPQVCKDIDCPALYILAEFDQEIKAKQVATLRDIVAGKDDQSVHWYEGTTHGFAVRGEEDQPVVRAARQDALEKQIDFFKKYL
ncbi:hypothetical protein HDV03_000474 [Kappamyces sp. JEL0829]|nr:hypothetical protein HDV03_000474 [Kappamyces sp. JEL0829]KAJ3364858.1 hypothetical protein HDU91_002422 [Kappamyces sp. JEL0680]